MAVYIVLHFILACTRSQSESPRERPQVAQGPLSSNPSFEIMCSFLYFAFVYRERNGEVQGGRKTEDRGGRCYMVMHIDGCIGVRQKKGEYAHTAGYDVHRAMRGKRT